MTSDGGVGNVGVLVDSSVFDPADLVIDGGTVEVFSLSDDATVWDMNIKNASVLKVTNDGWHDGLHPQDAGNPASGFSKLTYTGVSNRYVAEKEFIIMGELIYGTSISSSLGITVGTATSNTHVFNAATQLVWIDGNSVTQTNRFDADDVTISMCESGTFEPLGPDYSHSENEADWNEDDVLFTDSPCVRPWEKVVIRAHTGGGGSVLLIDLYISTPISGGIDNGQIREMPDALYVIDLQVDSGAEFQVNADQSGGGAEDLRNVYYTGTLTNNGSIKDFTSTYTPIQLTSMTYGDFDGDKDGSGDSDDETRFNDHFPSDVNDLDACGGAMQPDCYDALVDADCDGDVDCDDRTSMLDNWPNSTLDSCS